MSVFGIVRVRRRPDSLAPLLLRAGSDLSFLLSCALLAASLVSFVPAPGDVLRTLRLAMLWFGVPALAAAMTLAASAAHRMSRDLDLRELHRLRERLYFVAALGVTVLLPSALLGMRVALMPRPGGAIAVQVVETGAWLLAAILLRGNVGDSRRAASEGDADQPADESSPERSISSIR